VKPSLPDNIEVVNVEFTGAGPAVPPMVANNATQEYYEITVDKTGPVKIIAHTVWGALHGLETLTQLFEWNGADFVVQRIPISIKDQPRFPWRGFLADCSRHFLPLKKLRDIVDTIVTFKMNVLHLHLSDAQSFPMEIPDLPSLVNGAFSKKAVYSTKDMEDLVEYARIRGVMVLPEADVPAHTAAWRAVDEDVTSDCFDYLAGVDGVYQENRVALNPACNLTWSTIDTIIKQYAKTFSTSAYTHVGGDEVSSSCWEHAKQKDAITAFMKLHNIATYPELEAFFDHYSQKSATSTGRIPVVWEDVLQKKAVLPGTIVHAWRSANPLIEAVKQGNMAITSFPYYLDRECPLCTGTCSGINWMFSWTYRDMYGVDPTKGLGLTPEEEARVLGGEAALWGESVDSLNFDQMAISRLGAFAERFWSPSSVTDPQYFERRSQRLRCLNIKRGFAPNSGSLSSDFCESANLFN